MLNLCPQRCLFDQGMLDLGLSCARLVEHSFFRNCIAGGIHADLFQTVFSDVIPSIGLCIESFLHTIPTKAHAYTRALDDIQGSIDGKRSV
jgi:hypothetical protein